MTEKTSDEIIDDWIARKLKEEPDWRPYCLKCNTMGRMTPIAGGFKCNGEVMLLTPLMVRQRQVITDELPDEVANFFQHAVARLEEERRVDLNNSIAKDD